MTTDRDRTDGSPWGVLGVVLGIGVLMILGFAAYFKLPKLEAHYHSIGQRLPFALECLISASHWAINYLWVLVLVGLLAFFHRSPARRGDRPIS
jgi:type II secretory pathway component PulF